MFLKLYLISLPIFFAIDLIWLGFVAKDFYSQQIGYLLSDKVNWLAAVIFYLIFLVGLVIFVIIPAVEKSSIIHALALGALFGLVTYAAYDLTNLATVKGWPIYVTVIDLIWGSILSAIVSVLTYLIYSKFFV